MVNNNYFRLYKKKRGSHVIVKVTRSSLKALDKIRTMKSFLRQVPSFGSTKKKEKNVSAATAQEQQTKQSEPHPSPGTTEDSESRSEMESSNARPSSSSLRPLQIGSFNFDIADPTTNKRVTPYV